MDQSAKTIDPRTITDNAFKLIADDWMLITAGNLKSFNMMTANWGAFGELWHKKVCFCFVRPTRHTFQFMEKSDVFTLSFFAEKYRPALDFCGKMSGRDVNKAEQVGLTPAASGNGSVYFSEARLMIECRKIYTADVDPARFLAPEIHDAYPRKDYHRMYVGEILDCLVK